MYKITTKHGEIVIVELFTVSEVLAFNISVQEQEEVFDALNKLIRGEQEIIVESNDAITTYTGCKVLDFTVTHDEIWLISLHMSFEDYTTQDQEEIEMMAYIWANQIMIGRKTIDDIKNAVLKEQVRQVLIDLGLEDLAGIGEE